jgi:uncharacterized NAD-dependent epimerase/dehydratase family protein
MISGRPVVAVAVNHEGLRREDVPAACAAVTRSTGLPAYDVLLEGGEGLAKVVQAAGLRRAVLRGESLG